MEGVKEEKNYPFFKDLYVLDVLACHDYFHYQNPVGSNGQQVATASYGHRYPRPARLKVASVEVSRAAALEGPMRRF